MVVRAIRSGSPAERNTLLAALRTVNESIPSSAIGKDTLQLFANARMSGLQTCNINEFISYAVNGWLTEQDQRSFFSLKVTRHFVLSALLIWIVMPHQSVIWSAMY